MGETEKLKKGVIRLFKPMKFINKIKPKASSLITHKNHYAAKSKKKQISIITNPFKMQIKTDQPLRSHLLPPPAKKHFQRRQSTVIK